MEKYELENLDDIDLEISYVTSNVYGIYVDVSNNISESTYSAVFNNGQVGIGVTEIEESYALEINGGLIDKMNIFFSIEFKSMLHKPCNP